MPPGVYKRRAAVVEAMRVSPYGPQMKMLLRWVNDGDPEEERARILPETGLLEIRTICGPSIAILGEWVVKEADGDFHVFKDANFRAAYAPI